MCLIEDSLLLRFALSRTWFYWATCVIEVSTIEYFVLLRLILLTTLCNENWTVEDLVLLRVVIWRIFYWRGSYFLWLCFIDDTKIEDLVLLKFLLPSTLRNKGYTVRTLRYWGLYWQRSFVIEFISRVPCVIVVRTVEDYLLLSSSFEYLVLLRFILSSKLCCWSAYYWCPNVQEVVTVENIESFKFEQSITLCYLCLYFRQPCVIQVRTI